MNLLAAIARDSGAAAATWAGGEGRGRKGGVYSNGLSKYPSNRCSNSKSDVGIAHILLTECSGRNNQVPTIGAVRQKKKG